MGLLCILFMMFIMKSAEVDCSGVHGYRKLFAHITRNQEDIFIRPVTTTNQTVLVGFRFEPTIAYLDEENHELKLRGKLTLKWKDHRLAWKPTHYDNITETEFPIYKGDERQIWTPELVLKESFAADYKSISVDMKTAKIYYDGSIHWSSLATTTSFCLISVVYYPFDTQTCQLIFTTWLYHSDEQTFSIDEFHMDETTSEVKSAKWIAKRRDYEVSKACKDSSANQDPKYSCVYYTFELRRGHAYWYNLVWLCPLNMISIIILSTLFLPPDKIHEACNLNMTCTLALFVFLTFLYTQVPATGMPVVGVYIMSLISEGSCAMFLSVWVSRKVSAENAENAENKGVKSVPRWAHYVFSGFHFITTLVLLITMYIKYHV